MSAAISVLKLVIEQRGGVLDLQYMVLGKPRYDRSWSQLYIELIRFVLQSSSVKLLDRYRLEVYSIQATNVDRSYRLTFGIDSFGIRMNATGSAKTMADYVFVKLIGADICIGCMDGQLRARHEPQ